jgi:hypothetical protein
VIISALHFSCNGMELRCGVSRVLRLRKWIAADTFPIIYLPPIGIGHSGTFWIELGFCGYAMSGPGREIDSFLSSLSCWDQLSFEVGDI